MMSRIIRLGIDLAKNHFSVCGVDKHEKIVLEKSLKRHELAAFFNQLAPCIVAMESGSGAHHWCRLFESYGHCTKMMAPQFVSPYRRGGVSAKNDRNDARAICEAAGRPDMHFIPLKTVEQQAMLMVHRIRHGLIVEHTRNINQLRGLLAEFGIVFPRGATQLKQRWREVRQLHAERIPAIAWEELDILYARIQSIHQEVLRYDRKINAFVREDDRAKRLATINGIGVITASALVAAVGNAHEFKNGRQFAAWLGLTPRQYSTGGKSKLGRISKRGDPYLRTLLVHGARSEMTRTAKRDDHKSRWVENLRGHKPWNKVAVALANKNARVCWAVLNEQPAQ